MPQPGIISPSLSSDLLFFIEQILLYFSQLRHAEDSSNSTSSSHQVAVCNKDEMEEFMHENLSIKTRSNFKARSI